MSQDAALQIPGGQRLLCLRDPRSSVDSNEIFEPLEINRCRAMDPTLLELDTQALVVPMRKQHNSNSSKVIAVVVANAIFIDFIISDVKGKRPT